MPEKKRESRQLQRRVESRFQEDDVSRIIEMAWEDRTPFDAINEQYGLSESNVIRLMRRNMKPSSFRMWRERVSNRQTKHAEKRGFKFSRDHCPTQYKR